MPTLNANQKAKLHASFQYLDELLGTTLEKLDRVEDFLFPPYQADVSPIQRELLGDYLNQLRHAMRRFLDAQGMVIGRAHTGAGWALRIALSGAQIALDELRPKNLRGYGDLSDEGEREVSALLASLGAILRQMDECLAPQGGSDLAVRLAQLEAETPEALLLREIAEITTRHGLVEFRQTLLWLLERMEEPCLEVAFFGRVSSGKSSLINWLLEADVLPTGVTPVTTVPTRIVAGKSPRATIHFAAGKPLVIELARLHEFVSEQANPDNAKHVAKVGVEFPARQLRQGVCFVDTPGLGSLATAGAMQTLTYLPRCDVAVLLVDAAAGLGAEDISIARSLQAAGADLIVLLSRADLLASTDQNKMLGYLQSRLENKLGANVSVWPVSVRADSQVLAQHWLTEALAPRLGQRRELGASSLRRKMDSLRGAVIATLEQLAAAPQQRDHDPELGRLERETGDALSAIESARGAVRTWGDQRRERLSVLLDAAAALVAQAWAENEDAETLSDGVATLVADAIRNWAGGGAAELGRVYARLSKSLAALPQANILFELPAPSGQPLFDATGAMRSISLQRGIAGALGSRFRQRIAREQLGQQLSAPLDEALSAYERVLQSWALDYLVQLERTFFAATAPVVASMRAEEQTGDAGSIARDIARLKDFVTDNSTQIRRID